MTGYRVGFRTGKAYVNQDGPQPNGGTTAATRTQPTVFLADPDVTLHHGDVLETLRGMPDGSVDCVITSPPYWGLRDYGTGAWEGGDPDCDHLNPSAQHTQNMDKLGERYSGGGHKASSAGAVVQTYRDVCGKCGATRQDQQLGLEATPDLFVQRMVDVFREVRRVLAAHGTCWVNLGDSYASGGGAGRQGENGQMADRAIVHARRPPRAGAIPGEGGQQGGSRNRDGVPPTHGLKPKDLVGIPWRVAFALQADGWYLRSDIIWAKPNPMPESVTDRPTKSHEYVFLLTKQPRYWFDQEAVREPALFGPSRPRDGVSPHDHKLNGGGTFRGGSRANDGDSSVGRNIRSVWEIATQPYPEAHFATYPEELVRRCLLAGCPEWVCRECGKPRERIVDVSYEKSPVHGAGSVVGRHYETGANNFDGAGMPRVSKVTETTGWSDCGHANYRPGVVLDPFVGSGTTCHVARKHGRHAIGIDLNADYLKLAARRLQQQSLFAEGIA